MYEIPSTWKKSCQSDRNFVYAFLLFCGKLKSKTRHIYYVLAHVCVSASTDVNVMWKVCSSTYNRDRGRVKNKTITFYKTRSFLLIVIIIITILLLVFSLICFSLICMYNGCVSELNMLQMYHRTDKYRRKASIVMRTQYNCEFFFSLSFDSNEKCYLSEARVWMNYYVIFPEKNNNKEARNKTKLTSNSTRTRFFFSLGKTKPKAESQIFLPKYGIGIVTSSAYCSFYIRKDEKWQE